MTDEQMKRILRKFRGEEPTPGPTPEEQAHAALVSAEWEAHSIECEWIEANVPATDRHEAFAELDRRFKGRGIIDPTWRGSLS